MWKIGGNDACPCMSGRKYKSCCDKTGFWDFAKKNGMAYYDEAFALKELLSTDTNFQRFYGAERNKISKPVLFFQSDNLQSEVSFGNMGETFISLLQSILKSLQRIQFTQFMKLNILYYVQKAISLLCLRMGSITLEAECTRC